jgi:prepilin-type N-terminal cleavage/methylation domain-containing protein
MSAPIRCRARYDVRAADDRVAGFTLLEVVLSLVIFSLLTLMVYGAFFVGHRAVLKGERAADENQRMRVAEDILGREVRSAVIYFAHHQDETAPYFLGRSDGLSFVTAAPQARGGTGLAVVTYKAIDGQLVLEERVGFTPHDLYRPPADAHVDRAVLLSGFSAITFEYRSHDDTETGWARSWDAREEDNLPIAVRVTVDGLPFFGHPWVREIPIMSVAYHIGDEETQEPEDEEDTDADTDTDSDSDSDDADEE